MWPVPPAASDVAPAPGGDALLADGTTVRVRPVEPADGPELEQLLDGLSFRSRWFRFFSGATDVEAAARLASKAPGVVALAGDPPRAIGHALLAVDGKGGAEVAFEVADSWQGRGVGTLLLGAVAELAAARGIELLTAVVLPANHAMIDVFRDSGLPVTVHASPGELNLEIGTKVGAAAVERFGERERAGAVAAIEHFLRPASIAVVGVGSRPGNAGAAIMENLRATFDGPLHAIGRGQSVLDVTGPIELAVVAVPAAAVEAVARDCADKGVAALLVVSAGFEDAPGRAARARLSAFCRSAGMRLIGPNCLGVATPGLNATFARARPAPGRVALVSQSGGIGIAALEQGAARGIGLSAFVSIGDRADISSNDVIQWCEEDPGTDVIALYLESFGNPRRFARIARRVTRRKPIVAVKAGRSAAGARAAGSHTGAIVSASDATVDALFAQAGVIRTATYGELLDVTQLIAAGPIPAGRRLGVVTNGGGPAILLADAAEAAGMELPAEPADLLGDATVERFREGVAELAADPRFDALAIVYVPTLVLPPEAAADAIVAGLAAGGRERPVAAVFLSGSEPPPALAAASIPVFAFPEDAARALAAAARYGAARSAPAPVAVTVTPPPVRDEAAAILADALASGTDWLLPAASHELARCYGLPLVESRIVRTPREAAAAAADLGGPVALKAIALGLVHKTDAGAVRLGLTGRTAVLRAARELQRALRAAGHAPTGYLVQRMAPAGVELLVGIGGDRLFGPVIACAAGGTATELLADASIRLAPLSEQDVHAMPRELRTFPLLDGHRGAPRADVPALEDVLRRVSLLATEQPAIAELDCNPVIVSPAGVAIVDLRVRVRPPPQPAPIGSLQAP
jgi:acyl-CoA synthetase (NDP forming)/GNAT superfamily N-acetyltransferase